eukprot:m.50564 g.50564  ORF g.50564 m.50564 type:complete len:312 (+) comp10679_c0_seq2:160-1095(+)
MEAPAFQEFALLDCLKAGFYDSLNLSVAVKCIFRSQAVRKSYETLVLLNGVLFLGSILLFTYVIKPWLLHFWDLGAWAEPAICGPWNSQFVLPMYFLSLILNVSMFQEVSDGGHDCVRGSKASKTPSMPLSTLLATMCYSIIMQQIMLVQAAVVGAIPELIPVSPSWKILMWFIKFAITSWMASFYCFEYTWIRKGWDFQKRVVFFEQRWAYFFAYGIPITLCTIFLGAAENAAIFSVAFPLNLLNSAEAKPKKCHYQLPICVFAKRLTNNCVAFGRQYTGKILRLPATVIVLILLVAIVAATCIAWVGGC